MKAYYNHMNRMNRSSMTSQLRRTTIRTIRINRNRKELRPDDPPDIRRVLEQLSQQNRDSEPETPIMTVSQLYASGKNPTSGAYAINDQNDMDALIKYSKDNLNTKGITFTLAKATYNVTEVLYPVKLKRDNDTNSPIPVGTGFEGTLIGNGATIHLTIGGTAATDAAADSGDTLASVGLFGVIGVNGKVKNLILTGEVSAGADAGAVGALAGYNSGFIDTVTVTDETTIKAPNSYNVGGIVGFNDALYVAAARGTIFNSENSGAVTGYEKVGGICGENSGLIASCSNSGTVRAESNRRSGAGGIAGRNGNNNTALEEGQIFDCCNTGFVVSGTVSKILTEADKTKVGQWVGGITGFQNLKSECKYCYNAGRLLGYSRVHSIIGENDNTPGIKNCYGLNANLVESAKDQDEGDGSELISTAQLEGREAIKDGKKILYFLNGEQIDSADEEDDEPVRHWKQTEGEYPVLANNYDCADALTGEGVTGRPGFKTVCLDDFDGDLAKAATAAGAGGTVILTKPVTINQTISLYDRVTYKRGYTGTDAMFTIDVPNVIVDETPALGYVTMTTAIIDGNGAGTLFRVVHGRLRLRGNITLANCETAVSVDGQGPAADLLNAQVEVNYATIDATFRDGQDEVTATNTAIKLANANSDFILDAFDKVDILGTIYLGVGAYITVAAAIPCELDVEAKNSTVIAKGTATYKLGNLDVEKLNFDGELELNAAQNTITVVDE